MFSNPVKISIFVSLLIAVFFTRFIKLDWGDGFYFHPDESNMASSVTQIRLNDLNPHFFAYGQFPLYLAYFTGIVLNLITHTTPIVIVAFDTAIIILRVYSAICSVIGFIFVYKISQKIFTHSPYHLIFPLLFIFNPGLIQMAHFGTTESLLILVFLANIYISLLYIDTAKLKYIFFMAIFSAIGVSSKLSSFIFLTPGLLALLYVVVKEFKPKYFIHGFSYVILTLLLGAVFSPYNLIHFSDFVSSMNYETQVATGDMRVFYTNQFTASVPYVFQLFKIFPYSSGIIIFILALIGSVVFALNLVNRKIKGKQALYWSIILIPSVIYFVYFGQLYVKWYRFMSPIFFIFPLMAAYLITQIKNIPLKTILVVLALIPGFYYLRLYRQTDIRLQFSRWVEDNIPENSSILSEAGNVINIPLSSKNYQVDNFDFYNLDENEKLPQMLSDAISHSDYIIIPSRRIFKNQSNANYPYSQNYYYNLFFGKLGFTPMATFRINNSFLLNAEEAEETYSVFDQPVIRVYKKTNAIDPLTINNLILNSAK